MYDPLSVAGLSVMYIRACQGIETVDLKHNGMLHLSLHGDVRYR